MLVHKGTLRYEQRRDRQEALRQRLRELAAVRVRFGYRRLTVLLKREGWPIKAKRGSTGCTGMKGGPCGRSHANACEPASADPAQ